MTEEHADETRIDAPPADPALPDFGPEGDPDAMDAAADSDIEVDLDTMIEYRAHLHGSMYQELAHHYPGRIDFGYGIVFDDAEKVFQLDTGYDLGQLYDSNATLQERIRQLVDRGVDPCTATSQAQEEFLSMDSAFHDFWSDDLVPRLVIRIASFEALTAELEPHLIAAGIRMSREQLLEYVDLWFGEWLQWSEVHWMDRCEPIRDDLPVAWRSPGGSIEVLAPTSGEEEYYIAAFFTEDAWENAEFETLQDGDDIP